MQKAKVTQYIFVFLLSERDSLAIIEVAWIAGSRDYSANMRDIMKKTTITIRWSLLYATRIRRLK